MLSTRFLNFLQYEKNYSKHTISSYGKNIQMYEDFLQQEGTDIRAVNPFQVRAFLSGLRESGHQARSINQIISTLRSFYKFLLRENIVEQNPMQRIKLMRTPKQLPTVVSEDKLCHLLDGDNFPDNLEGRRDRLILEILFGTGIRQAELLALKEEDFDAYQSSLRVFGKGRKERLLPLTSGLVNLLKTYIEEKKQQWGVDTGHLLVGDKGTSITKGHVYQTVKKYLSLITSQKKRSPHVLRHTFATALLNNGAHINDIKELLGHASLASTQIYAHNSAERLKSIYKQAHPKA